MSMQPAPEVAPAEAPQLRVLSQFVKELSFQNSLAAATARGYDVEPTIDMGVEVKSRPMGDMGATEVDLCIKVDARRNEEQMFSVNLVYSGLFQFVNARDEDIEPLIWIECPRLLFPFSRQLLAEITREGGYPPLMLNPIDFAPLYWAEQQDRQTRAAGGMASF
jgi:preprotein translocase subunit SecB